jgi:hypothetical protein
MHFFEQLQKCATVPVGIIRIVYKVRQKKCQCYTRVARQVACWKLHCLYALQQILSPKMARAEW